MKATQTMWFVQEINGRKPRVYVLTAAETKAGAITEFCGPDPKEWKMLMKDGYRAVKAQVTWETKE